MSAAPRSPIAVSTASLVSPVFNEAECLEPFYRRVRESLGRCGLRAFEIIFVDDGSTDATPELLQRLAERDPAVKVLTLSRNFGHHPAVFAGLEFAGGDAVIVLDADLQDPPELLPELLAAHRAGHELVFAKRRDDEDPLAM